MKVVILSVLLTLLLSSCAGGGGPIDVRTNQIDRTKLDIPAAEPVDLRDPDWIVITENNADRVFSELQDNGYEPVIIGLTDSGYQKLSVDFLNIRRHISAQRQVVLEYKRYYEGTPSSSSPDDNDTQ